MLPREQRGPVCSERAEPREWWGLHPALAMGTDMRGVIADGGTGARGGLLGVPGASAARPMSSSPGRHAEKGVGRVWAQGGGHSLRL